MKFIEILLEAQVDPEVEKVQRILLNRGYYLGHTGPNKDGIDGILGPLTKQAYKEYYKNGNISSKCNYFDDKIEGKYIEYYENGNISSKCNKNGQKVK